LDIIWRAATARSVV